MTTAVVDFMATKPTTTISQDQLTLIKETICKGATKQEMELYFFDCQRHGVHPLDKLLHFTVHEDRNGGRKYTPITSIDFMRQRAASTGEYLGTDKPVEVGEVGKNGFKVEMVVKRLIQGHTAQHWGIAKWEEYFPGEKKGFMWKKMPSTMLEKCAEAKALRKGFPKELAGLYAREEMDQAQPDNGGQLFANHEGDMRPNTWITGWRLADYTPKDGKEPYRFVFRQGDGGLIAKANTHMLPIPEMEVELMLGRDVEYMFVKKGSYHELTALRFPEKETKALPHEEVAAEVVDDQTDHARELLGGTIRAYGTKTGENKSGPWTNHQLEIMTETQGRLKFSTFSLSGISEQVWTPDMIERAIAEGWEVECAYVPDGSFKKLTWLYADKLNLILIPEDHYVGG